MSSEHKENCPPSSPLKQHNLIKDPNPTSQTDTEDETNQRGRKRRRSSANSPPALHSSVGNNFRGRGRNRSLSAICSSNPSQERKPRSSSPPGRKYQKKSLLRDSIDGKGVEKRRSQSPSRSRSKGVVGTPVRRRRQRTRTRSRSHAGMKEGTENKEDAVVTADTEAKETL